MTRASPTALPDRGAHAAPGAVGTPPPALVLNGSRNHAPPVPATREASATPPFAPAGPSVADRTNGVNHAPAVAGFDPADCPIIMSCDLDLLVSGDGSSGRALAARQQTAPGSRPGQLAETLEKAVTGSHELNRRTTVAEWWPAVGAMVRADYGARTVIRAHVPPGLPEVRIAPHNLTRMILDLVANAARAIADRAPVTNGHAGAEPGARSGEVKISARLTRDARAVEFTVAHNGVGMARSVLARVFEPYSADPSRRCGEGGSLAIVHRLADEVGGSVRVSSAVGAGTTIIVSLPIGARHQACLHEIPVV